MSAVATGNGAAAEATSNGAGGQAGAGGDTERGSRAPAPAPAMGAASEAVTAFLQVAGGAARELATEKAGDPRVSAAFALGWQLAELYRSVCRRMDPRHGLSTPNPGQPGPASASPSPPSSQPIPSDDLPGISALTQDERDLSARKLIGAAVSQLSAAIQAAGLTPPPDDQIGGCVSGTDPTRATCLRTLHVELLSTLTAADSRLGKAYGLGRALSDTSRSPRDKEALRKRFKPSRVARLRNELDDLSTAFPPHAANAVGRSLNRWSEALWPGETPAPPAPQGWRGRAQRLGELGRPGGPGRRPSTPAELPADRELLTYARRQGQMWRALLSGEKNGEDMLRPADYVEAAGQALGEVRGLLRKLIVSFPLLSLLVVLLFAGGIALMIGASGSGSGSSLAGAAAVLASAGITWKGIGTTAGGIAGRVEQRLWGSELDQAITDATFLLNPSNDTSRLRRRLAAQAAEGKREQMSTAAPESPLP